MACACVIAALIVSAAALAHGAQPGVSGSETGPIVFSDLDFGAGIVGVKATSDVAGFSEKPPGFSSNSVTVSHPAHLETLGTGTLAISLVTAAVPGPAAPPPSASAPAVLGLSCRRAHKAA